MGSLLRQRRRRGRRSIAMSFTSALVVVTLAVGGFAPSAAVASQPDTLGSGGVEPTSTEWGSSMTIDRSAYSVDDELVVHWETDVPNSRNWIGIHLPDQRPGTGAGAATWKHTTGESSGTLSFNLSSLEAGEWVLWYLENDGYVEIAEPIHFTVTEWGSSMAFEGREFHTNEQIVVEWETSEPNSHNWIGLYRPDQTPGGGEGHYSAEWEYTTDETAGTVTLDLVNIEPGEWLVRYFANGGYNDIAEPIQIIVTEPEPTISTLEINGTQFEVGDELTVTYGTENPNPSHRIGIFWRGATPTGWNSSLWDYAPLTSGVHTFTLELPPGNYDVWYLATGDRPLVAEPLRFTLSAGDGMPNVGDPLAPPTSVATVTDISTDGVLLREGFADGVLPAGWSASFAGEDTVLADGSSFAGWSEMTREGWRANIDEMRHRFARTHGGFVVADAQQFGAAFDATLESAPIEVALLGSVRLTFDSHYRGAPGQVGTVSASFDEGEWEELLRLDSETVTDGYDETQMNAMQDLAVAVPEGAQTVRFAWDFTVDAESASTSRYWGIDSVTLYQGETARSGESTNAWIVSDIQGHPHDLEHGLFDFHEVLPGAAGLLMVGDIVDKGAESEWDEIYEVFENTADIRPEVTVASMGNHERYSYGGFTGNFNRFLEFAERDKVYGEYVLEGAGGQLPVITIGQEFVGPSEVSMSDAQVEFLEERLAYWTAQGSQVVVNTHFPLGNTVSSSWRPTYMHSHQMNARLTNILGNYPNAIIFTGHTHYPVMQGDWAMQRRTDAGHPDGFWAVNTIAMHNGWDTRGENTVGSVEYVTRDVNYGLTLESYGDRVVVKAYDFQTDELMREQTIHNPLAEYPADIVQLADYTAVDAALAEVPADLSLYTDESVAVLNAAIAAVERGLTEADQAEVDAFAAAIQAAIDGLELRAATDGTGGSRGAGDTGGTGDTDGTGGTGDTGGTGGTGDSDLATTGAHDMGTSAIAFAVLMLVTLGGGLLFMRRIRGAHAG